MNETPDTKTPSISSDSEIDCDLISDDFELECEQLELYTKIFGGILVVCTALFLIMSLTRDAGGSDFILIAVILVIHFLVGSLFIRLAILPIRFFRVTVALLNTTTEE